ncbi:hypothetical protein [Salinimicrobium sp. GXAS 041]|uniref:hypothetical protein n=1 Tax=Salinimicrobium sp. GXAS 041 TaxID=3400806 RepID=UPI003C762881
MNIQKEEISNFFWNANIFTHSKASNITNTLAHRTPALGIEAVAPDLFRDYKRKARHFSRQSRKKQRQNQNTYI